METVDENDGASGVADDVQGAAAWQAMVDGLAAAGRAMADHVADLSPAEQADGFRALLRSLNNQLGRFEVDRADPELVPFNGWREKFFMDNPDFHYWVADIDDGRRYRLTGRIGDASYTSITAYAAGGIIDASAASRLDQDSLELEADGSFEVMVSREQPPAGNWLPLPQGANSIWVRSFYDDVHRDAHGEVHIEALDSASVPPLIDTDRFVHRLQRLGKGARSTVRGISTSVAEDLARPNEVRVWEEMQGGAAFTEPGIHYQRGAWQLGERQALEIRLTPVECRYWNLMLYSRFLNSLDHRHRPVSLTGARAIAEDDSSVRVLLSATDPGEGNWLDTEGRPFGIFVVRWLHAETAPQLPELRVVDLPGASR
ncbi:MAG: DUF1214 domain-containing protein [Acidimicrobiales bacterium]